MKKISIVFIMFFVLASSSAQLDTLSIAVKSGAVSGYWRNYFMATQNEGSLKDWSALATGGLLKYETGRFKNFKIGVGYYTSYNLNVSDVGAKDSSTNKVSRYESGLFDVADLSNREINFLGELYINYKHKQHEFTLGRMKLKTAFINPEDGRMIPTLVQGLLYKVTMLENTTIQAGWLTHIGVRSSSGFSSVKNSIGIYPVGKNIDGTASSYKSQLNTEGIGLLSVNYKVKNKGVELTNYFVENIFNTAYIKAYYKIIRASVDWKISAQHLRQDKVNNGGNDQINKAYFQQKQSNVYGLQLESNLKSKLVLSANYNFISGDGRFLFPREWGRETLFTFQKRERLEGVSNTHAFMLRSSKKWQFKNESVIKVVASYGQYMRPDVKSFDQNKYGMPSNSQSSLDFFYDFGGNLKGLGFEYLITYKRGLGDDYGNPNFVLNKVNMWNHNLIMNYRF